MFRYQLLRSLLTTGALACGLLLPALGVMAQPSGVPGPGGGPGNPPGAMACAQVTGDVDFTLLSDTAVEVSLTGDITGTLAATVIQSHEHIRNHATVSLYRIQGTITTATGTLTVAGTVRRVAFAAPPMPLMGGNLAGASFTQMALRVTGGTGDYADVAAGRLHGHERVAPAAMIDQSGFQGILCSPVPAPQPTP